MKLNQGLISARKGSVLLVVILICLLALTAACAGTATVTSRITTTITSSLTTTVTSTVISTVTKTASSTTPASSAATSATPTPTATATATATNSYLTGEALALGLISVKINGYAGITFGGVSSGDVVVISFQRQKPEVIKITVPLGTTLTCADSSRQNMVIMSLKGRDPSILGYYPASEITLNTDEWQEYLFEAYCLDMNKSNILNSTTFSIGEPASPDITAMLTAAKELGKEQAPVTAIQVALWVLTGNPSFDEIEKKFTVDQATIGYAWTILDRAGLNPRSKQLFAGYTPG